MTATPGPVLRRSDGRKKRIRFSGRPPLRITRRAFAREIALTETACDLIELAAGVLLADRLVRRRGPEPRSIHLSLPLRNPEVFRSAERELREVLAFLADDAFSFGFRRARPGERLLKGGGGRNDVELDRVALFSGGLDSACAAADLSRQSPRVAYVTQYTKGISAVEGLLTDICTGTQRGRPVHHASYFVQPWGPVVKRLSENTRRTRSFLFTSLALATAASANATEVLVCENGPLALNLPLGPGMVPTRHAHSQFLRAMERLSKAVFGRQLRVRNPYELRTKGEMARVFQGRPELALRTISCWFQQWSGRRSSYGKGHCGLCLPCLVRLASLAAAGIEIPRRHFDVDVCRLHRKVRQTADDRRRLAAMKLLVSFARKIERCRSWREFLQRFPDAIESEPTWHDLPSDRWYRRLYRTERRFAAEILDCFADRGSR